jgi:hypothetical protein
VVLLLESIIKYGIAKAQGSFFGTPQVFSISPWRCAFYESCTIDGLVVFGQCIT